MLLTKRIRQGVGSHFHDWVTRECDMHLATAPAPCWLSQNKLPSLEGGGVQGGFQVANSQQSTEALGQHPRDLTPVDDHESLEATCPQVSSACSLGRARRTGPSEATARFLTHRNCEMMNVCCVKPFKFRVIFSTAKDNTIIYVYTYNICIRRSLKKYTSVISWYLRDFTLIFFLLFIF